MYFIIMRVMQSTKFSDQINVPFNYRKPLRNHAMVSMVAAVCIVIETRSENVRNGWKEVASDARAQSIERNKWVKLTQSQQNICFPAFLSVSLFLSIAWLRVFLSLDSLL